jgi:hypothetical protein
MNVNSTIDVDIDDLSITRDLPDFVISPAIVIEGRRHRPHVAVP